MRLLASMARGSVIGPLIFLLCMNDLRAALGDSAFLFEDGTIPIKPPSLLPFFRLGLGGGMGPTNQPKFVFMPHCREPSSPFFVFFLPTIKSRRSPTSETRGFPLTVLSPSQCTAGRILLFMFFHRLFSHFSQAAFIPLHCAIV